MTALAAMKARLRARRYAARAQNDDITIAFLMRQGFNPTALREPPDTFGEARPLREWDTFIALDRAADGLARLEVR